MQIKSTKKYKNMDRFIIHFCDVRQLDLLKNTVGFTTTFNNPIGKTDIQQLHILEKYANGQKNKRYLSILSDL